MTVSATQSGGECGQAAQTAPYLDGELDEESARGFEEHARACRHCSASLLEQRRLLCLLDAAFDQTFAGGGAPALPEAFTRELKARAQNDMSGVRAREERRLALKICAALGLVSFALLGAALFESLLLPAARAGAGALSVAGRAASEAGAGAGLVVRAVGGQVVPESSLLVALQLGLFAFGCAALLVLIRGYHRRGRRAVAED